MSKSVIGKI
jgi:hypothetical protein